MRVPLSLLMIALLAASDASAQGRQRFVQGSSGSPSGPSSGGSANGGSQGGSQPRSEAPPSARAAVPRESRPAGNPARAVSSAPRSEASRPNPNGGGSARPERSAVRREPTPTQLASTPAAPAAPTAPPRSAIRYPGESRRLESSPASSQPQSRPSSAQATAAVRPVDRSNVTQNRPGSVRFPAEEQRTAVPRATNTYSTGSVIRPGYSNNPGYGHDRASYYNKPTYVAKNYYYYPHHRYPHGYGAWGIGYFYYDPYVWAPTWYYNGNNYGYGNGYPVGEIRLQVRPRDAEVYIDGYYAGLVEDFDGTYQALRLEEGTYHLQIVAPGFETIDLDVRIQGGRTITYRADMFVLRP